METAVLEALEQVDEDFGRPQLFHGTVAIYCVSCQIWLPNFQQYLWHVDHSFPHGRRSRVCIRQARAAIDRWEERRRLLRRELGLEQ